MPWKAISPYEKRVMNDIQDGEAFSVADRSREHMELVLPVRKIAFWIERTLFTKALWIKKSGQIWSWAKSMIESVYLR